MPNTTRTPALWSHILLCLLVFALADPVSAARSSGQRCVVALASDLGKVDKRVTAQIRGCLTRFARGRPLSPDAGVDTLEKCAVDDPKGKIGQAGGKTAHDFTKLCTPPPAGRLDGPFPEFGVTDAATINAEGEHLGVALAHDLFGPDLDGGALSAEPAAAACQRAAWKAATRCVHARLVGLRKCEKRVLAGAAGTEPVASKAELRDACLGAGIGQQPDPAGKIVKKCPDATTGNRDLKKCQDQDPTALFPGCASAPDLAQCLSWRAACRACLAASQAQDLDRDCDLLDDGIDNASCTLGPITVVCESPADASMLTVAAGSGLTFKGRAAHPTGIGSVTINGAPVAVGADGSFSAPITAQFGINFVDVVATNAVGEASPATCTFLAADGFAAEDALLDDDVSLRLAQAAVDDGSRAGAVDSFGDVLAVVLNSQGLVSTLNASLNGANPLKPLSCDQTVLGVCVLSSGIDYVNGSIGVSGPNTSALTLIDGGLDSQIAAMAASLSLRVRGQVAGIPYDTTGSLSLSSIAVGMILDVGVNAGRPQVSVRSGSVSITVGPISTSFSGLDGFVLNTIVSLANGTIRNLVANTLQSFIVSNFAGVLDDTISMVTLPTGSVDVPRIGEPGVVTLDLAGESSSLSVSPTRALFGFGTRVTAAVPGHAIPSLGIALPAGALLRDADGAAMPVAISLHTGAINQALHALWRGGLLQTPIDVGSLAGVPPGTVAMIDTLLPPVVSAGAGSELDLRAGAVHVTLTVPGLLDDPVSFVVGGEVSATVAAAGDALKLTNVTIGALHVGAVDASLEGARLALVQDVAPVLLQQLVDSALAGAAGAVTIPAFPVPASLVPFGLPAGHEFAITAPIVASASPHFDLKGGFGVR
jgi:hypothetical protein